MNEVKTLALCVRAEDYGENGKILTLITAENGKTVARIRSVKGPKSKLKQCASLFCLGEYILTRGKVGGYLVTGCSVEESFFPLWTDVKKNVAACVICETLDKFTEEGISCRGELACAVRLLDAISSAPSEPFIYAVRFLLYMLPGAGVDISEFDLPLNAADAVRSVAACDAEELETLDITESALVSALTYVNLIYRNKLGERLNSVAEALKILSECK